MAATSALVGVDVVFVLVDDDEEKDNPQNKSTERADPTDDTSMIFVTANLSQRCPRTIPPMMDVALKRDTMRMPVVRERPRVCVEYEGR